MINVLLFAQLQEESGHNQLQIDKANITVEELTAFLQQNYHIPSIREAMIAINETFADQHEIVKEGDTVAFIPPVSGG